MSGRCCGLVGAHGRCAFFCSGCIGTGLDLDDVADGRCPDCDGVGWFDDEGNPVLLSAAEYEAIAAACATTT